VVVVVVVPVGHKGPLVILLDCVGKQYCVLLPHISFDISSFPWPYNSVPSIAFCFVWQSKHCSSSSQFPIFLQIILYIFFCVFHCYPSVILSNLFFIESELCIICPKYFHLLILAKVSRQCFGVIWLVTDTFILLTVHGVINLSFMCFPLHPYSTAGKTVVYSS